MADTRPGRLATTGALSARQYVILSHLIEGFQQDQIGRALGIHRTTVNDNVAAVVAKLGARNSVQAAAIYAAHAERQEIAMLLARRGHAQLARLIEAGSPAIFRGEGN